MIQFEEKAHRYFDENNNTYTSATQFIEKFCHKFEDQEEFWLMYKALQYCSLIDKPAKIKKYNLELDQRINTLIFSEEQYNDAVAYALRSCNKDVEKFKFIFTEEDLFALELAAKHIKAHWKSENDISKVKGTTFHNWKEDEQFKDKQFQFRNTALNVVDSQIKNLEALEEGVHPELRLWNKKFFLAGTSDQIIILPHRKAIVRDWKTNKEFVLTNKYQKLKAPVDHLEDTHYNHYALQLSLYAWMLEQFDYEVIHLEVEHFDLQPVGPNWKIVNNRVFELPYLKKEIENMLDYAYIQKNLPV